MRVAVAVAPDPIVTPGDIPGKHAADDALVAAMIAAATANIDGPAGWLGRSVGAQTLDAFLGCFGNEIRLPFGPVIEVEEIVYLDTAGAEQTLPPAAYRLRGDILFSAFASTWPTTRMEADAIRVRYRAGYGEVRAGVLVSEVPPPIKAAIVLMTVGLLVAQERDGGLRSFQVDGAYTEQFNSPELMDRVRTVTVDRLLAPFRVFI